MKIITDEAELPELIIESESSNESVTHKRSGRKSPYSRTAESDIMSAETQLYDTYDDNDFVIEAKTRERGRIAMRGGATEKDGDARADLKGEQFNTDEKDIKMKRKRGRPRKNLAQKVVPRILVEETQQQEEMDLQEAVSMHGPGSQISVEETQPNDEEFDLVSVKDISEKEDLENKSHKAGIQINSNKKRHQIYAKTHNKVIFQEKNIQKDDLENEPSTEDDLKNNVGEVPDSVTVNKPTARGRKRKAKKEPVVTLVEETQDLDKEESGSNVSQIKRKRNCFKLNSSSEEESIAESQDIDALSGHEQVERTESDNSRFRTYIENSIHEKSDSGILPSNIINAKEFASPVKNKVIEENDKEGSQSPIISKRKTFSSVSKKIHTKANVRTDIDCEEEPFKSYKANSTTKKFKDATSSNLSSKNDAQLPFTKYNLQEDNEVSEGVRRFINRPSSKDSNASDNISTTSSQMSTNILDEKGDLYSTQFCEIKARKGKDFRSKNKSNSGMADTSEEILTLDVSDEDIPVLKEPKKTYAVKKLNSRNLPVRKDVWTSGKRDQKVSKSKNIQQFFSKVKQPGDVDVPIELDEDSDEDLDEPEVEQRHRGYSGTGITKHSEERCKLPESKSSYKNVFNKENEQNLMMSSTMSASDNIIDMEVKKVDKVAVNDLLCDDDVSVQYMNDLGGPKHRGKGPKTKKTHHLNLDTEHSQHILNDLSGEPSEKIHSFDESHSTRRQRNRHIESDANIVGEKSQGKRRNRRVSETLTTSAGYEADTTWSSRTRTRDQDEDDSEAAGHESDYERKRAGHRSSDTDSITQKKVIQIFSNLQYMYVYHCRAP